MIAGSIIGHPFQFEFQGKRYTALISFEALQDYFDGVGRPPAEAYADNAAVINRKAVEILQRGEHRSPFLLVTTDFEQPGQ